MAASTTAEENMQKSLFDEIDEKAKKKDLNTPEKCNTIIWNLVSMHHDLKPPTTDATNYVREFWETTRCNEVAEWMTADKRKTLASARDGLKDRFSTPQWTRVGKFEETEQDKRVARQAFDHYNSWHFQVLYDLLPWTSQLHYQTIFRFDRFATALGGLVTLGTMSWQIINRTTQATRPQQAQPPLITVNKQQNGVEQQRVAHEAQKTNAQAAK